ncbi:hypothetical protein ASC95_16390 [Pelomonas sp. Root1217]|uniref:hypothetical protein n=1 Tax=Pelomonas sp. Root1217 TaxID=1736430 RepID=UPI0007097782|nr:hypothetical protein [Pelomonas sp. Root1217]KQV49206.1 hypothetical protein ASC95_16390 [Pelomonas sp. Root1217]
MKNTPIGPALRTVACIAVPLVLAGCASIPDVTVSYRPVTWSVQVATAHTITCTNDRKYFMVAGGATYTPAYSADTARAAFEIQLKKLDRFYADSDFSLSFTDDGRLKSINQSTTGQGETITKAFVGVVTAVAAFQAEALPSTAGPQPASICAIVRKWNVPAPDHLPQVSLTQNGRFAGAGNLSLEVPPEQQALFTELKKAGLDLAATARAELVGDALQPVARPASAVAEGEVAVTLQQVTTLKLSATDARGENLGGKRIPVPLKDKDFMLPIPKPALFGKQTFQLAVAESGRITSLGYGSTSGAAGALGAVAVVAGEPITEDNARAAAAKAAADLIAQQQRLANCLLKPTECPK